VGVRNPRWNVLLLEAAMETFLEDIRAKREGPPITNNNDKYSNNSENKPYDNLCDGVEDANQNGRIDGDNGDGIYGESETWEETSPNLKDSDGDTFSDKDEKDWEYNPLLKDTDNDGLSDDEEDKNRDGVLDADETDPKNKDTDGDELEDKQEKEGWEIVIYYESTGEKIKNYISRSDPRDIDTDDDGLNDMYEYQNQTDPNKSDSDGDGKTDLQELTGDYNSSATGIDGEPPEIWKFDCYYEEKNWDLGIIKIPSGGLKVKIEVGVKDIFGIEYILVDITGLEDRILHTNNAQNVSYTFEWSVNSVDKYKRVLFKGFKINVSAKDRNGNIGFKEDELPSIKDMVVSFFLGPLMNIVTIISEIVTNFGSSPNLGKQMYRLRIR